MAQGTLLKRLPTLSEVAETAAFLASDRAGFGGIAAPHTTVA
jgi:hypothetical protein